MLLSNTSCNKNCVNCNWFAFDSLRPVYGENLADISWISKPNSEIRGVADDVLWNSLTSQLSYYWSVFRHFFCLASWLKMHLWIHFSMYRTLKAVTEKTQMWTSSCSGRYTIRDLSLFCSMQPTQLIFFMKQVIFNWTCQYQYTAMSCLNDSWQSCWRRLQSETGWRERFHPAVSQRCLTCQNFLFSESAVNSRSHWPLNLSKICQWMYTFEFCNNFMPFFKYSFQCYFI